MYFLSSADRKNDSSVPVCAALHKRISSDVHFNAGICIHLAFLCIHDLDTKFEVVKNLWNEQSKIVLLLQGWLEKILSRYDMMQMYDSWSHVLVNGVVVCQRILQDAAVLFLFVQVRNLVHKGKRNK